VKRGIIVLLFSALVLTGCYRGPGIDSPYGPVSPWPNGVVVDHVDTSLDVKGLYPNGAQFFSCCWMSRDATFRARIPSKARTLRFDVSVPANEPLKRHTEDVRIRIAGVGERTFKQLKSGDQVLIVPLPPRRPAIADVTMSMSYTWRPVDWNINGDSRDLSILLRRVRAK
jgi:hypothetical protein